MTTESQTYDVSRPIASAADAASYYSNSDNYYFLGNLQSLWMGEGADALG
ncbi:hypothetical protein SEEGA711_03713, partial [Salmonella enterica subsp. enterica serovar Gaminara str. ATCC BAA-711]